MKVGGFDFCQSSLVKARSHIQRQQWPAYNIVQSAKRPKRSMCSNSCVVAKIIVVNQISTSIHSSYCQPATAKTLPNRSKPHLFGPSANDWHSSGYTKLVSRRIKDLSITPLPLLPFFHIHLYHPSAHIVQLHRHWHLLSLSSMS